jgi:hypothetical protein
LVKAFLDRELPPRRTPYELLFYPKDFARKHTLEDIEDWRKPAVVLKKYARLVQALRKRQRDQAS